MRRIVATANTTIGPEVGLELSETKQYPKGSVRLTYRPMSSRPEPGP